jgi:predicted GH43/DUF377 family glycosyl hydrolase/lysophospholipase L1-like esterase
MNTSGIIAFFKNTKAKENMARGIIASFLGMLVVACSGCGGGGGSTQTSVKAQDTVLIEEYGDSTTVGCTFTRGAAASDACPVADYAIASTTEPAALQAALQQQFGSRVTVVAKGAAGTQLGHLLNSGHGITLTWAQQMAQSSAQIVALNFGINDSETQAGFADLLSQAVQTAQKAGKRVVIMTPNPISTHHNDDLAGYRMAAFQVAQEYGATVVDNWSQLSQVPIWGQHLPDGMHPDATMYQWKANNAAPIIAQLVNGAQSVAATPAEVPLQPYAEVTAFEANPVMTRGAAGTWDSGDVLNPSVISFHGKLINYYSGWDGTVWRTGYATSTDNGLTWTKRATPVLDLGQWSTKYIAANGSNIVINGQMYLYFHGDTADNHQVIGLATSSDGINFSMLPNPVVPAGPAGSYDDLHAADPYVIQVGNEYWMYYSACTHDYKFTMARATSTDGIHWTKDPQPVFAAGTKGDFDDIGDAEPSIIVQDGVYFMIMTSNKDEKRSLGWATSTDGVNWTKRGNLVPESMIPEWAQALMCDPTPIPTGNNDGTYYIFFGASGASSKAENVSGQIGRLTVKLSAT